MDDLIGTAKPFISDAAKSLIYVTFIQFYQSNFHRSGNATFSSVTILFLSPCVLCVLCVPPRPSNRPKIQKLKLNGGEGW